MKKVISYFLVFFLILLICITGILNTLSNKIFTYDSILASLEKNNYYNRVYISVNNHFENIIEQSGLDKTVLENIVTTDKIKQDVNESIKSFFEGKAYSVDVSSIKENLNKNINNYLKNNNRIANSKEKESINVFINKISSLYEEDIFPNSIIAKFSSQFLKIKEILNKILQIVYICNLVIVVLLLSVNVKNILKVLSYIGVALLSSGILLIVPKIIEQSKLKLNKLNLINVNISSVISSIALDIISNLKNIAIFTIIIGVILIIVGNLLIYRKSNKN